MVKSLFLSLSLLSVMTAQAALVPALVVGDNAPVALQDIVSVKFDVEQMHLLKTDGTLLTHPLQSITFGEVEEGSGIEAIAVSSGNNYAVYSCDGRLMKQGTCTEQTDLLAGLQSGTYIVRCGDQCQKVQYASSMADVSLFEPETKTLMPIVAPTAIQETGATALQLSLPGVDPQVDLSTIDSLYFSADQKFVIVERQGLGNAFQLAKVSAITFPALEEAVSIQYSEADVDGVNPYYFDGVTITNTGAGVVVSNTSYLTAEIEYVLSGSSSNGYFMIYSEYKWKATMMGLSLTNPNGSAILGLTGKKGTLKSQNGYENNISDGATYTELQDIDQKGAIFSEGQLVFSGKGTLNVSSSAKHAICSDDYVSFENGTVNVLTAAGDAVHANDSVLVQAGVITLASLSDGIDCEGPVTIRRGEKGTPTLTITTTANGAKGIKTGADFLMSDGNVTINQTGGPDKTGDDKSNVISIKADGNISILGGVLNINNTADGGKGLSAGGSITISESATVRQ